MLKTDLLPKEIYHRREELGLKNSVSMLAEIVDSHDSNDRLNAIKYLGLISDNALPIKKACFKTLENILISDESILAKCEAAKALGKTKYGKALEPLKWILDQRETDRRLRKTSLKAIANIRFEEPEIKLFIKELSTEFITIRESIKSHLTLLEPERLVKLLLESLSEEKMSVKHKFEIIHLIGYELSSINVSFEDVSYISKHFPDMISDLKASSGMIVETIIENYKEHDLDFMNSILTILKVLGDEVNGEVIRQLDNDDFIVKSNAIKLFGKLKINDKVGISKLIENLDDMYSEVSKASIESLGDIGELSTIPALLKVLNIEDTEFEYIDLDMKWFVLDAVKKICLKNPKGSCEYLYEGLEGDNEVLKESIAFLFGELGQGEFVEPLIELMNERNLDVRKNAIIALGKIGNSKAIKELLSLLDQDYIYWLLKKVSIDAIYNIYYRNWRAEATEEGEMKREFIMNTERLIDYLNSHNNECFKVKLSIIKFLREFGDETSLNALLRLVNDFHRLVRISASKAIKQIEERLELEDQE